MPPAAFAIDPATIPNHLQVMQRFFGKVDMNDASGCWLWMAGTITPPRPDRPHYGSFWIGKRQYVAHRFLDAMVNGPIPNGIYSQHLCNQTLCVRPGHLVRGSHTDNMLYMHRNDRHQKQGAIGEEHWSAVLTEEDVEEIMRLGHAGEKQSVIGNLFGISASHVGDILRRESWEHLTHLKAVPKRYAKVGEDAFEEIKKLRATGMLQREIGAIFGVNQSYISALLSGNIRPRPDTRHED